MSPVTQQRLATIVEIAVYFLDTRDIMWSSGDDGYDKVLNAYCFFSCNILENKIYYIHRDFVDFETPLANACKLCNLIRGKYDT